MTRFPLFGAVAAFIIAALILGGCGGGSSTPNPPPAPDTGIITGRVVRADSATVGIAGASVIVRSPAGETLGEATADSQGRFTIRQVPVGSQVLMVDTVGEGAYGTQTVTGLPVARNATTDVLLTVLRVTDPAPSLITLTPATARVDLNGSLEFSAAVQSSTGLMAVTPTYYVTGGIGVVSYDAVSRKVVFTATQEGAGKLRAVSGTIQAEASLTVVPATSPQITSFLVAPTTLPATGGTVTITVAATDGDGIKSVQAEVFRPDSSSVLVPLALAPGTQQTYRTAMNIPANTNAYGPTGVQPEQRYSVRAIVTDYADNLAISEDFIDFVVQGLQAPPAP